jgi:hypothetical protein
MGFFTGGLTDQHFLRRGRLGRLIVALEITGSMYGYGVEENSALDVDLRARTITALGPGPAAVVVDISGMERVGAARRNVRVSLLRSGDVVRLDDRRIFPRNSNASMPPRESAPEEGQGLPGAWSAGAVTIALDRLARNRTTPVELHSNAFDLRFSADERTRFLSDKGTVDQVTACDVRLDITPRTETRE